MTIPYLPEIQKIITDLVLEDCVKDYDSVKYIHKKKLTALALHAYGYDVELVLGSDFNKYLSKFLLTNDECEKIEMMNNLIDEAIEKFSYDFDQLIQEKISDIKSEENYERGLLQIKDRQTGETVWRTL